MATCPAGHQSASDDFCEECGLLIGAAPSLGPGVDPDAGPAAGPGSGMAEGDAAGSTGAGETVAGAAPRWSEPCPVCATPRDGQFCENCGHNFANPVSGTGPAPPGAQGPAAQVPDVQSASAWAPDAQAASAWAPYAQAASAPSASAWAPDAPSASAPPASVRVPDPQAPGAQVPAAQVPGAQVTFDPWPAVSMPAGPVPGALAPGAPVPGAPGPASPAGAQAAAPPPVPSAATWTAVVTADRAYYDDVLAASGGDAAGIAFPAYCPQRRFPLDRAEVRIGRHSVSSGITPEIDLSVPPADPGISRLHAVLLRAADGGWAIVDPGSANGTLLNGAELAPGQVVPVREGDRIHLGAWTEVRLTCGA